MEKTKIVIITRAAEDAEGFKEALQAAGFESYHAPSIRIVKKILGPEDAAILESVGQCNWCIFTSAHAVSFFLDDMNELGIDRKNLRGVKIATVGEKTAAILREAGLTVDFIPTKSTGLDLAAELDSIAGQKILIPHSEAALPDLEEALEKRGARVTTIDLYTTESTGAIDPKLEEMLQKDEVGCLTFASSSAVASFVRSFEDAILLKTALALPAVCIGPRTLDTAHRYGFSRALMSKSADIAGIIETIAHLT